MSAFINSSQKTGMNIKGKAVSAMNNADTDDDVMAYTLERLNSTNPFLPLAAEALSNWQKWSDSVFTPKSEHNSLTAYITHLWSIRTNEKYIIRRLLCRLHTEGEINYIQDFDIPEVTEHNLYGGIHSTSQVQSLCKFFIEKYNANGITTVTQLQRLLLSDRAKNIVKASRDFEKKNGTSIKPSFFYIEEFLKPEFVCIPFKDSGLPMPIGYYSNFSEQTVLPYQNMKVVMTNKRKPIAIIKAKFFSQREFPRRVKEEGFTGLTAKYDFINSSFKKRYGDLPLIMFIDMIENFTPPDFAIRRLVNYGWIPFFQATDLKKYLLEKSK
jgi:hypothetical protein